MTDKVKKKRNSSALDSLARKVFYAATAELPETTSFQERFKVFTVRRPNDFAVRATLRRLKRDGEL